jgi:hypothetical protein
MYNDRARLNFPRTGAEKRKRILAVIR